MRTAWGYLRSLVLCSAAWAASQVIVRWYWLSRTSYRRLNAANRQIVYHMWQSYLIGRAMGFWEPATSKWEQQ